MTVTGTLKGGLGNNLFIISTILAYSMKHNCDYYIPTVIENPHSPDQKVFYSKNLKYCEYGVIKEVPIGKYGYGYSSDVYYTEPYFHYKEIPKYDCDMLHLFGYFQSWRYVEPYREEILKILDIPYEFKEGWCSIHVRRNDYLKLENFHPVVDAYYLINAIEEIYNKTSCKNFLVFGDDIDWNKKFFKNIFAYDDNDNEKDLLNFQFSENKTGIEDLSLASSCEHSIGSNSSFSWFIYWLNRNENKIGIMPKKWFGESLPNDTKDLYMPKMILI